MAALDVSYLRQLAAITLCKLFGAQIASSNEANVVTCKTRASSIASKHVRGIFFRGAKIEMFRIDALSNIAMMVYLVAFRNGANKKFVGNPVSVPSPPLDAERTIAIFFKCASPKPARLSFGDFGEKSLLERDCWRADKVASTRAIKYGALSYARGASFKRASTLFAGALHSSSWSSHRCLPA